MIDKQRKIYISGPMTGMPDYNFPAFHEAARYFAKNCSGWEVMNPAENFGGRTDLSRETYLRADIKMLAECDAIAMLTGWENSRGAKLEYLIACELGLLVFHQANGIFWTDTAKVQKRYDPHACVTLEMDKNSVPTESILTEAARITSTDRQSDYGHPRDDFAKTAKIWNGILTDKLASGQEISADDIPLCMIGVKLARQAHKHKRDNLVDLAGYAQTASMLHEEEE